MDIFNPYYLQIVMFFIINAILGISIYFTLASGQLSLGAAGFMSVGAYVGALLSLSRWLCSRFSCRCHRFANNSIERSISCHRHTWFW